MLFREKDNPERRFDYLDEILGTIGKGTLGLTINCARCHDHKFDPIRQRDYYALEASIFGYVETEVPLAPPAEAAAYLAKNEAINAKRDALRQQIGAIEKPHRDRLELEQIKNNFSEAIYRAAAKPEAERTAGEKLLAIQVYEAVNVTGRADRQGADRRESSRASRISLAQIAALEKERPGPLPMAEIATDGDYRFSPLGEGDNVVSCPKCRIPPPFPGSYLHKGPGRYEVPPSYFLIRGDVESRGPEMQPGFIEVITYGHPPTVIPRPDGRTSGRRSGAGKVDRVAAEPVERAGHRQSPLAETLRPRHRGDARELRQDGRAADASGAARLAGRRVHEPRLEHQADQQADDDVRGLPDGLELRARRQRRERSGQSLPVAIPAAAARGRDRARQHAGGWREHQSGDRRRADFPVHPERHPGRPVPRQMGEHARKGRRHGAAGSTSIGVGRFRTRCSTRSTIRT